MERIIGLVVCVCELKMSVPSQKTLTYRTSLAETIPELHVNALWKILKVIKMEYARSIISFIILTIASFSVCAQSSPEKRKLLDDSLKLFNGNGEEAVATLLRCSVIFEKISKSADLNSNRQRGLINTAYAYETFADILNKKIKGIQPDIKASRVFAEVYVAEKERKGEVKNIGPQCDKLMPIVYEFFK